LAIPIFESADPSGDGAVDGAARALPGKAAYRSPAHHPIGCCGCLWLQYEFTGGDQADPMIPETKFLSELIGTIYDTALDRTLWPGVLKKIRRRIGGVGRGGREDWHHCA